MEKYHTPTTDALFHAILSLTSVEECYRFFEDVCTIKEVQDMAQRLEVAKMLKRGMNYLAISKATGASTATISRVNKCLNYGSGGYEEILSRMEEAK